MTNEKEMDRFNKILSDMNRDNYTGINYVNQHHKLLWNTFLNTKFLSVPDSYRVWLENNYEEIKKTLLLIAISLPEEAELYSSGKLCLEYMKSQNNNSSVYFQILRTGLLYVNFPKSEGRKFLGYSGINSMKLLADTQELYYTVNPNGVTQKRSIVLNGSTKFELCNFEILEFYNDYYTINDIIMLYNSPELVQKIQHDIRYKIRKEYNSGRHKSKSINISEVYNILCKCEPQLYSAHLSLRFDKMESFASDIDVDKVIEFCYQQLGKNKPKIPSVVGC